MAVFNNKQFIFLVVGAGLTGYWLYKKTKAVASKVVHAVNPLNRENIIHVGFDSALLALTGVSMKDFDWHPLDHKFNQVRWTSTRKEFIFAVNIVNANPSLGNIKDIQGLSYQQIKDFNFNITERIMSENLDGKESLGNLYRASVIAAMKEWNKEHTVWYRAGDHWGEQDLKDGIMTVN